VDLSLFHLGPVYSPSSKFICQSVAARNIFGWVGRHFNVIITFFIMFVVIAGKEFLC
jgi:hypothetical protein